MDSNLILIKYFFALCCSLAVEVYIQLLYLRHCVTSLLRIRFRNSGVQDNVYVIVAYFFVEPVTQLYISHIQEHNNFIKTEPRNVLFVFYGKLAVTESACTLNKKGESFRAPCFNFWPCQVKKLYPVSKEYCSRFMPGENMTFLSQFSPALVKNLTHKKCTPNPFSNCFICDFNQQNIYSSR